MPRNQEVIRQWKVLQALESSRHGTTIPSLAAELNVTTRTIRRDLAALQEAGFPLFDERDDEDGGVRWRLDGQVLKGLETGFTLQELCALYLSRNLLEAVAATPFQRDLGLAFTRLEKLLSPRLRTFLDRLPSVLTAKPGPRARGGGSSGDIVGKLLEAVLHYRVSTMRYHSVSSRAVKDYLMHPYRLAFAQGGLYLLAYVPAYKDIRTFAVDRIVAVSLEKTDVRAEGADRERSIRELARRQHRTGRQGGDRVRAPGCPVRPCPGLARVPAAARGGRRNVSAFDERVSRLGTSELGSELGALRARPRSWHAR